MGYFNIGEGLEKLRNFPSAGMEVIATK